MLYLSSRSCAALFGRDGMRGSLIGWCEMVVDLLEQYENLRCCVLHAVGLEDWAESQFHFRPPRKKEIARFECADRYTLTC